MSVYCDIVCNIGYISEPISAKTPISVKPSYGYTPILHRYRCNIGADIGFFADIGEKSHDIGDAKLQVYTDIHRYRCHIGDDIGVNSTISCTKMPISGDALFFVPISCYLVLVYRYRCSDIGLLICPISCHIQHDIGYDIVY